MSLHLPPPIAKNYVIEKRARKAFCHSNKGHFTNKNGWMGRSKCMGLASTLNFLLMYYEKTVVAQIKSNLSLIYPMYNMSTLQLL
jgi:hypothetical protein